MFYFCRKFIEKGSKDRKLLDVKRFRFRKVFSSACHKSQKKLMQLKFILMQRAIV